jgi:hypothetical protein
VVWPYKICTQYSDLHEAQVKIKSIWNNH